MQHTPPLNGNLADPDRPWINADPGAGVAGSRVDADFFNRVQAEILAVITGAGLVPTNADLTQLYQAISSMVTGGAGGKVAKAGDSMTGALTIALAALQLALRHTDNTASIKDHLRLFRGSSAGTRASLASLGDAANGLSEIDLNFLAANDTVVKAFKFKNSGQLELGANPTLALEAATKQYVDALIAVAASNAETQALALTTKYVSPGALGALVASTTQRGIQRNATDAEYIAMSATNLSVTPSNIAGGRRRSSAIAIVLSTTGTWTHGLGVNPRDYRLILKCVTANGIYGVGEEVVVNFDVQDVSNYGFFVSKPNATTLRWQVAAGFRLGGGGGFTPAQWEMYLEVDA